jgi:hypothetical protein
MEIDSVVVKHLVDPIGAGDGGLRHLKPQRKQLLLRPAAARQRSRRGQLDLDPGFDQQGDQQQNRGLQPQPWLTPPRGDRQRWNGGGGTAPSSSEPPPRRPSTSCAIETDAHRPGRPWLRALGVRPSGIRGCSGSNLANQHCTHPNRWMSHAQGDQGLIEQQLAGGDSADCSGPRKCPTIW